MSKARKNPIKQIDFIDLFSGCGGWTEGLMQGGFRCIYSVDNWSLAVSSHDLNHPGIEDDAIQKDILDEDVFKKIKSKIEKGNVHLLVGSPPCTQFSFSNKGGKGNIIEGMVLVRRYLEVVDFIQNTLRLDDFPWVMENVPRLKQFLEKECVDKEAGLYRFNYIEKPNNFYVLRIPWVIILNSADYGTPQKRRRVLCGNFHIPKITHVSPSISHNKKIQDEYLNTHKIEESRLRDLPRWRTLRDILQRLPDPLTDKGKDLEIEDPNYPLKIPIKELNDHFYDTILKKGTILYKCHKMKQHHPVYGVMNFPDDLDQPARTLMATEMEVSRETMIVPLNIKEYQNGKHKKTYEEVLDEYKRYGGFRRLTIRELATLQGFPIDYQFYGDSTNLKHKQIGNAVSPFLAKAFAKMFSKRYFSDSIKDGKKGNRLYVGPDLNKDEIKKYNKTALWKNTKTYDSQKRFNEHLRCTKSNGQRIDIFFSGPPSLNWCVNLCLGSGKDYKNIRIDRKILIKIIENWLKTYENLFFRKELLSSWFDSIKEEVSKHASHLFGPNKGFGDYFRKDGSYIKGSPLFFAEKGVDQIIEKITKDRYSDLKNIKVLVSFDTETSKGIDLFTLLALFTSFEVVMKANAANSQDTS